MPSRLTDVLAKIFGRTSSNGGPVQGQTSAAPGRVEEAEATYREILARTPDDRSALEAIALIDMRRADFGAALRAYDRLVSKGLADATTYYRRGNVKHALGMEVEAIADFDAALDLDPARAAALCNRGVALGVLGRWEDSLDSYERAIQIDPEDSLAFYNCAAALRALRRPEEALRKYEDAIRLNPRYAEAFVNRGHLLQALYRYREAVASYDAAIALNVGFAEAFEGRALAWDSLKEFTAAKVDYERALSLDPHRPYLRGQRRFAMMQVCEWSGWAEDESELAAGLQRGEPVSSPFPVLAVLDSPATHQLAARLWAANIAAVAPGTAHRPRNRRPERLRIGYFSPDFREHAVAHLVAGVLEAHDRSEFETVAFAFGPRGEDPMRRRLERAFDRFIDVENRSDADIAELARSIQLDIAVDMAGYTAHARPGIFARRPAPISISYLGYPGTMGAEWMDYLVGDPTVLTLELQAHVQEKFIVLPNTYLPYGATNSTQLYGQDRHQHGLPSNAFVYCCFNNLYKLTPPAFDVWMRILAQVPESVLWLSRTSDAAMENLKVEAEHRGIDPGRLIFAPRLAVHAEHLARSRLADLFLDTWPYNAHATAMDALYSGLPVLTKLGYSFAARVAGGVLHALGMPELVCTTEQHFESTAVALARNPERLRTIQQRLDELRLAAPVFSATRYARDLERAYLEVYARYFAGLKPENVHIT